MKSKQDSVLPRFVVTYYHTGLATLQNAHYKQNCGSSFSPTKRVNDFKEDPTNLGHTIVRNKEIK